METDQQTKSKYVLMHIDSDIVHFTHTHAHTDKAEERNVFNTMTKKRDIQ